MNWYYVDGGQQAGPVDDAQLEGLVRAGKVQSDTLVWHEGMANWQMLSEVKPPGLRLAETAAAPPIAAAPGTEAVCAECGRIFNTDDMIRHEGLYICANCKPVFMQKLSEGARIGATGSAHVSLISEDALLARDYRIELGDAIGRAWKMFTANAGTVIAATILIWLCIVAGWVVTSVVGLIIPFINGLLLSLLTGVLMGGMWRFCLSSLRGETPTIGLAFSGFRSRPGQLMLCSFVQTLFLLLCYLPMLAILLAFGLWGAQGVQGRLGGNVQAMGMAFVGLFVVVTFICVAGIIYLQTIWFFSIGLVADKGYNFWPAMRLSSRVVRKRWWMTFLFALVAGILLFAGVLLCLIGMLASFPIFVGMKASLYEDNFRDLAPANQ